MRSYGAHIIAVMSGLCCASCSTMHTPPATNAVSMEAGVAEERGWTANLKRGSEIIHELLALSPERLAKVPPLAYCGERVAFVGGPVLTPLAHASDLGTEGGFYLRIVNPQGKDLRPRDMKLWEVIVCGKILQVLPKNKIIVIEVNEPDWQFVMSG